MPNSIPSRPSSASWSPRFSEAGSSAVSSPREPRPRSAGAGSTSSASRNSSRPSSGSTVLSPARALVPPLALHRAPPLPTRRNLAPAFDAVAWDTESLDSQQSLPTWRSGDSVADAVQQVLDMNRNEANHNIVNGFPQVVQALKNVVADINERTEAPAPGEAGFNTPLWRGKVEMLDANFLDRLIPLAFARALLAQEDDEEGVFEVFDALGNAPESANARFCLMAAQEQAKFLLETTGHDPLTLSYAVEQGIETRRWLADQCPQSDALKSIKNLGNTSIALATWLPATVRAALVQAACAE